jgi:hypothetical protein
VPPPRWGLDGDRALTCEVAAGTVAAARIDLVEELGIIPERPLPYWGWGEIPDQYGRRWQDDDAESEVPPDPGVSDLPPLRPWWGTEGHR